MSDREMLSARVDSDSDLVKAFEEYQGGGELTKSEAFRNLVRAGLESKGYLSEPVDEQANSTGAGLAEKAYEFAVVQLQMAVVGFIAASLALAFVPDLVGILGLLTAAGALACLISLAIAATAARIEALDMSLRDRVLARDDADEPVVGDEPAAEPGGD